MEENRFTVKDWEDNSRNLMREDPTYDHDQAILFAYENGLDLRKITAEGIRDRMNGIEPIDAEETSAEPIRVGNDNLTELLHEFELDPAGFSSNHNLANDDSSTPIPAYAPQSGYNSSENPPTKYTLNAQIMEALGE